MPELVVKRCQNCGMTYARDTLASMCDVCNSEALVYWCTGHETYLEGFSCARCISGEPLTSIQPIRRPVGLTPRRPDGFSSSSDITSDASDALFSHLDVESTLDDPKTRFWTLWFPAAIVLGLVLAAAGFFLLNAASTPSARDEIATVVTPSSMTSQTATAADPAQNPAPAGTEQANGKNEDNPFASQLQMAEGLRRSRDLADLKRARELYMKILSQDPENAAAKEGIQYLIDRLMERAEAEWKLRNYDLASTLVLMTADMPGGATRAADFLKTHRMTHP